jgi:hypothetical protein
MRLSEGDIGETYVFLQFSEQQTSHGDTDHAVINKDPKYPVVPDQDLVSRSPGV